MRGLADWALVLATQSPTATLRQTPHGSMPVKWCYVKNGQSLTECPVVDQSPAAALLHHHAAAPRPAQTRYQQIAKLTV